METLPAVQASCQRAETPSQGPSLPHPPFQAVVQLESSNEGVGENSKAGDRGDIQSDMARGCGRGSAKTAPVDWLSRTAERGTGAGDKKSELVGG